MAGSKRRGRKHAKRGRRKTKSHENRKRMAINYIRKLYGSKAFDEKGRVRLNYLRKAVDHVESTYPIDSKKRRDLLLGLYDLAKDSKKTTIIPF
jgi:hypothetical protein